MDKDIRDYMDTRGYLVKGDDQDAGDSCHKTMHWSYIQNNPEMALRVVLNFECPNSPAVPVIPR